MSQDAVGGKEERECVRIRMDVKIEQDCCMLDTSSSKRAESGELDQWTTPLKLRPRTSNCWMDAVMAPVKAKRSQMSNFTKDENCGARMVADSLQMQETTSNCTESPLRCCPKFDNMSHDAHEAYVTSRKEMNGTTLNSNFEDWGHKQSLKGVLTSEKMKDEAVDNLTTIDFSGGELGGNCDDGDEDMCIIGSKYRVINTRCPLSGKLVTALEDPVQSANCHHVYDQASAKAYINHSPDIPKCAIAGCSKSLSQGDLVSDTSLTESIRDLRQKQSASKLKLLMECVHIDDD